MLRGLLVLLFSLLSPMSQAFAHCQDILFTPSDESDARDRRRHSLENALSLYMLRGFFTFAKAGQWQAEANGDWRLACQDLSTQAQQALRQTMAPGSDHLTHAQIEKAWAAFSLQGFANVNYQSVLKENLAAFTAITRFREWPREIIDESVIKQKTRIIYRSPAGFTPRLRVAQTHNDRLGSPDTPVRETEVALERGDGSGDWDFFVYDHQGEPSRFSEFPSGHKASPAICMACHFNASQKVMGRIFNTSPRP